MASVSKNLFRNLLQTRSFSTTLTNKEKQQFLVVIKDFTDDKALERRLSVREQHLAVAKEAKKEKYLHVGGAILDNHQNKKMQGSFLLLSADNQAEAEKIVKNDIYYTSKVWEKYEIYPVKSAITLN